MLLLISCFVVSPFSTHSPAIFRTHIFVFHLIGVFERRRNARRRNFRRQEGGGEGGGGEGGGGVEGAGEEGGGEEVAFVPEPGRCVNACSIATYEAGVETNNECYGKYWLKLLSLTKSVDIVTRTLTYPYVNVALHVVSNTKIKAQWMCYPAHLFVFLCM